MSSGSYWQPKTFVRYEANYATSTGVARIVTDAGVAYLKGLGNPEGPHALASEWVGTRLAHLFGLQTFDFTLINIDANSDEIPLRKGSYVQSGPAFCTRAEPGRTWDGTQEDLERLVNRHDISRLVVFDTWIRNRDRHHPNHRQRRPNRDNVFLGEEGAPEGSYRLIAMDHTHCFGNSNELNRKLATLDIVRDRQIYGLFSEFMPYLQSDVIAEALEVLRTLRISSVDEIVVSIPAEWEVDKPIRTALRELICERAKYVAENFRLILEQDNICLL